ncbi:MAG TPA: adenylate/guanylate cyclase domain-containing protein [Candidatus Binatia bacterium]|nr:adenylate/guanylate cyclase domain-containing protein [Candidatus Binatia bacterium]
MLPTGTVTFLFSDIEGSTQRWESHREAMDVALKRHDAHLRAAIEGHGGHVFKTVGDAFCGVFARASDGIAACVDAQRSLGAEDFSAVEGLRVRCALHTGEAVERNGDYFGPAVNRVARLMSIGYGGQILVSGVTRDIAHSALPAGTVLVDLGSHRLKDLTEAEHVWQLNVAGLQAEFAPLRSLDALLNNLPISLTTFVGRKRDVAAVEELLGRHRLLTLVGSGGLGKTRLALQVAAELLDRFPDGVWFADLAPITDPELVSSVVAQSVGMSQESRRLDEAIPQWLKRKKLLLILDNCEHVLETAATLASSIVRAASSVSILATSRQALDIAGEVVHRLPALSVPAETAGLKTDEAFRYGAVALFADRAYRADTRFAVTDDNAPVIADICRRLDGIPLAIELAAARVKALSIPQLAKRLDERFRILTGGSRDALPRQRTLSALIDWSYDLLAAPEQLLFARLGIFAGGFGLDAAASVCAGTELDELDILDLLASLTDKSLVVSDTSGDQDRYRLLESTAAYALEKLRALDEQDGRSRRHAEYFRDQAAAAEERRGIGSAFAWLAGVELELDNYRAALEWTLTQNSDAVMGGAITGALLGFWADGGLTAEGRYWIGLALERLSEAEQPRIVARLHFALGVLSSGKRRYDEAQRALKLYESLGDAGRAARAQRTLAFALYQMGERLDEATMAIVQALATSRECGDKSNVADCLNVYASLEFSRGDLSRAEELYFQALAAYRALEDEAGTAIALGNIAELEFAEGRAERALGYVTEALELASHGKNAESIATYHANSAAYRIALGDLGGARKEAREGLRLARQAEIQMAVVILLEHLAVLSALNGDRRSAARLVGYVNVQCSELGLERASTEQQGHDKLVEAMRETLSEHEIAKLEAEGATWTEDQAVEEALKV